MLELYESLVFFFPGPVRGSKPHRDQLVFQDAPGYNELLLFNISLSTSPNKLHMEILECATDGTSFEVCVQGTDFISRH